MKLEWKLLPIAFASLNGFLIIYKVSFCEGEVLKVIIVNQAYLRKFLMRF